eukprot:scaffold1895_cov123-Isochrysis_galbana.AAC.1
MSMLRTALALQAASPYYTCDCRRMPSQRCCHQLKSSRLVHSMVCTMLRGCAASPGCCGGCSMVRSAAWRPARPLHDGQQAAIIARQRLGLGTILGSVCVSPLPVCLSVWSPVCEFYTCNIKLKPELVHYLRTTCAGSGLSQTLRDSA